MAAVEVDGLTVRYGDVTAVAGVAFEAQAGEVTAVLGPNGAGKTTTIEVLEGFRRPDAGRASVLGLDPRADHAALTRRVGVMLQSGGVGPGVRVLEVLRHAAALYDDALDPAALLARVGLTGTERRTWRQISGGEQRRLSLALALVGRPQVAFLDEPGSGVDPQGRLAIRDVVRSLRDDGVTVVLTTHDLDEVEKVADHVVILDHGAVVAAGSPAALMTGTVDEVRFGAPADLDVAALSTHLGAAVTEVTSGEYLVSAAGSPTLVAALTAWLAERDLPLADLRAGRQRLEDVFLRLVSEPGPAEERPPPPSAAPAGPRVTPLLAHLRLELALLARNGESLLLTLGIPALLLVFFANVDVLPIEGEPIDFLAPGVLSLAVVSTALVNLAIGTAFEREYGVLKRLGATPLGRPRLLAGKGLAILVVEVVQVALLWPLALALGWDPSAEPAFVLAVILGTAAFAGLGLCLAGTLKAMVALAAANGLYLVLLLLSGMVIPLEELPAPVQALARALPSGALTEVVRGTLTAGVSVPGRAWAVLAAWAIAGPLLATRLFRWE